MKKETRKAKLAALLGIELPKPPTKEEIEQRGTVSREAEAVILFGIEPKKFIQKECLQCGLVFAVDRTSIGVCSDICRQHYLLYKFGIEWDPSARTLEERWSAQTGGPEPLIVPPTVLPLIEQAVENKKQRDTQQSLPSSQSIDELLASMSLSEG